MMLKFNVLTRLARVSGGVLGGLLALVTGPALSARDAYLLISGGGTPLNNNYSQYLQAPLHDLVRVQEGNGSGPLASRCTSVSS